MKISLLETSGEVSSLGDVNDTPSILKLFSKEKLEEIQLKIGKATGLAFVTVDYKGEPVTETTCFTDYCRLLRETENACICCKKSDAFGALQAVISRKPSIYFCPCGLLEVAIPIENNGVFLGGFIGGQVRCDDAPDDVSRLEYVIKQDSKILDDIELNHHKNSIKNYSYNQFIDVVNLIHMIINQICETESNHVKDTKHIKERNSQIKEENKNLKFSLEILEQKMANFKMNQNQYFMANILSSISNMATLENATKTNELILELADYMRNSSKSPDSFWSLGDELEQIEHYIKLSCAKYEDSFTYHIRIFEKMRNRKVPVHCLLPFVENAIYYGIALKPENRQLQIDGTIKDNVSYITITENGPGLNDDELQEHFKQYNGRFEGKYIEHAMYHASKRLANVYGYDFEPEIHTEHGRGRKFIIKIPNILTEGGLDGE